MASTQTQQNPTSTLIAQAQAAGQGGQSISDASGRLFVSRPTKHDILSAYPALTGDLKVFAGMTGTPGFRDGQRKQALLKSPIGIAVQGTLFFIADTGNQKVRRIDMNSGAVTTPLSVANVAPLGAAVFGPRGVGADATLLYISDNVNHVIWRVNTATLQVKLFAGAIGQAGLKDGTGTAARFNKPDLVVVSPDGRLISVADQQNTVFRLIERDGTVSTISA